MYTQNNVDWILTIIHQGSHRSLNLWQKVLEFGDRAIDIYDLSGMI